MANYTFLDAYSSVQTAQASAVSGTVLRPQIDIGSVLGGVVPVQLTGSGNTSVSGAVGSSIIGQLPAGTATLGSVAVLQGTNPLVINGSVSGTVGASVVGNVNVTVTSIATAGQVLGSVAALQGTMPWAISGSVAAFQAGTYIASLVSTVPSSVIVGASVFGNVGISGTPSISGTVNTIPTGTIITSLVSTVPSSVIVGTSMFGQLPAGTAVLGSIATLQGTTPWLISSVYGNVSGSVAAFQGGAWTTSVVGGPVTLYAPTASFVSGVTSVITGTTVTSVIAAAPGGQRNYITQVLVTNQQTSVTGAGTQVNLIDDGSAQVMYAGYAAAGGGGFAITFPVPLRQPTSTFSFSAKALSQASVIVAASGYTAS